MSAGYEVGRSPRVLVGADSIAELPALLGAWQCASAVLIVDAAISGLGYVDVLKNALQGVPVSVFVMPAGEPSVAVVNAAATHARKSPRAAVIGLGGGSALDIAKQVAAIISSHEGIEHYLLCAHPFPARRPIVAIPTTAGTGAEVTRTCIVSDADGRKLWTWGDEMLPDLVILDASLTATMPAFITAATGLDAFVHALEACTAQRRNALSSGNALQAIRLVKSYLVKAVQRGDDLAARRGMQEAALLAGLAIDNCGTGIAHCIGHALGTLYHLPHGIAVTLALEATLAWNIAGAGAVYADAADIFGVNVADLPGAFAALLESAGFADALRGLRDATLEPQRMDDVMIAPENQPMLSNNARAVMDADRLMLATRTADLWKAYRA